MNTTIIKKILEETFSKSIWETASIYPTKDLTAVCYDTQETKNKIIIALKGNYHFVDWDPQRILVITEIPAKPETPEPSENIDCTFHRAGTKTCQLKVSAIPKYNLCNTKKCLLYQNNLMLKTLIRNR